MKKFTSIAVLALFFAAVTSVNAFAASAPTITTTALADAMAGRDYNFTLKAKNTYNPKWSYIDNWPRGLINTLDAKKGIINIKGDNLATAEKGDITFKVTNQDGKGKSDTKRLTLRVLPLRVITKGFTNLGRGTYESESFLLKDVKQGTNFKVEIKADAAQGSSLQWVHPGRSLPSGLSWTPKGFKGGYWVLEISGKANEAGEYHFLVQPKNKYIRNSSTFNPEGSKEFVIKVQPNIAKPKISNLYNATVIAGENFSYQCSATGTGISWSASGLPDGLKIDKSTGKISGKVMPTIARKKKDEPDSHRVKITASNSAGSVSKTLTFSVYELPNIVLNSYTLPSGTAGKSYNAYTITAMGTAKGMRWTISSGSLPQGMKISTGTSSGVNSRYCTISGVPKRAGKVTFTLRLRNSQLTSYSSAADITRNFTININNNYPYYDDYSGAPYTTESYSDKAVKSSGYVPVYGLYVVGDNVIETGSGRDEGIVYVIAGDLTFKLEGYTLNGSEKVYVNDKPIESITLEEDGTFIFPAEFVVDGISVQVKGISGVSEILNINVAE